MSKPYFANLGDAEIGSALMQRINDHFENGKASGRWAKITKSYAMSVGATVNGTGAVAWGLVAGGEQGELVHSVENHYRNLGMSVLNLTTGERPTIQCSAANTDSQSLGQSLLADGLIDFYLTKKGVESLLRKATKRGIFQSEGFVYVPWDPQAGEPYMPVEDEGGEVTGQTKTGDVAFHCLGPLDVVRDEWAESWEALSWVIVRLWKSRYDLAAQYPELASKIVNLEVKSESETRGRIGFGTMQADEETDLVAVWEFFHKRTPAVPDGKQVTLLSDDVILFAGPLPYSDLPVYRVCPDDLDGTPYGDTPMFDLMGPQDVINGIDTATVTNQLGRGIGNLLVPEDADVVVEQLAASMNAIKYKGQVPPTALEYPAVPSDLYQSKKDKIAAMETLSGVSSVTRGNPSENVGADASGAKLALIDAKSIQANSGVEKSYVGLVRDVCGAILSRFRDFGGDIQRIAQLAGKNNQYLVREFVGSDLKGIDLVKVEMGNPVLRTTSGKMAVADKAVELGVIKPGQLDKYLMLLRTGQEGPLFEVEQAVQMRIRGENEALLDGSMPHQALITDPHWKEIPDHLAMLDNPAIRTPGPENQEAQQRVLQAVQQHIDLFMQMPPWMAMVRGGPEALAIQQQIMAAMMPQPVADDHSQTQQPAPGTQTGTPPPESGAEAVTDPMGSKPEQPGMPSMPNQPNGEPAINPGAETIQ